VSSRRAPHVAAFAAIAAFCHPAWAAESASVFSNYKVYPETGDCGGQTLTLVRDGQSNVVRGFFQGYEGNCESDKVPVSDLRLDRDGKTLSFAAGEYVQDARGKRELFAKRRFVVVVKERFLVGKTQYCRDRGRSCDPWEAVRLPSVKRGTP
jgi:hypothetical protein